MLRGVVVLLAALALPERWRAAQARDMNVTVRLRAYQHPIRLDTLAIWTGRSWLAGRVLPRVRKILDSLKIPVTMADASLGLRHNSGFNTRSNSPAGR